MFRHGLNIKSIFYLGRSFLFKRFAYILTNGKFLEFSGEQNAENIIFNKSWLYVKNISSSSPLG